MDRCFVPYGIPPAFLRYLDPLLAAVPDHEEPARFELPEINRLLQKLTRSIGLGWLTGVGLPLIARQQVVGVLFVFRSYSSVFRPTTGPCCRASPTRLPLRSTMPACTQVSVKSSAWTPCLIQPLMASLS
jgi:hypothetical protein